MPHLSLQRCPPSLDAMKLDSPAFGDSWDHAAFPTMQDMPDSPFAALHSSLLDGDLMDVFPLFAKSSTDHLGQSGSAPPATSAPQAAQAAGSGSQPLSRLASHASSAQGSHFTSASSGSLRTAPSPNSACHAADRCRLDRGLHDILAGTQRTAAGEASRRAALSSRVETCRHVLLDMQAVQLQAGPSRV